MDEKLQKLLQENLTPAYCCQDGECNFPEDNYDYEDLLNDRFNEEVLSKGKEDIKETK